MLVWNRDELKARIEVITAEAESNLKSAQLRLEEEQSQAQLRLEEEQSQAQLFLEQEQSQATEEQERLTIELEEAHRIIMQITIERNELQANIQYNVSRK